jgi:hypothetical protein
VQIGSSIVPLLHVALTCFDLTVTTLTLSYNDVLFTLDLLHGSLQCDPPQSTHCRIKVYNRMRLPERLEGASLEL